MPGYGFSGKPTTTGWDQARIARAWAVLMKRLGYTRYVAQGGDWGAIINDLMASQAPPELIGIHTNLPAAVPPEINKAAAAGGPAPSGLSAEESARTRQLTSSLRTRLGYALQMGRARKRCTASRIHPSAWQPGCSTTTRAVTQLIARALRRGADGLTRDDVLDNITLFWLTNTAISAARLYWENKIRSSPRRTSPSRLR